MRDIATAQLTGNLTSDIELRALPSGADVARLRLASTARRRHDDEWVDKTNYFTVDVYGAQARACAQHLAKGSRVLVEGELDWREWNDQHGNHREAVTITARRVLFEGARPTTSGNGSTQPPAPAPAAQTAAAATPTAPPTAASGVAGPDDLPF